jgi:hypothetical protein
MPTSGPFQLNGMANIRARRGAANSIPGRGSRDFDRIAALLRGGSEPA